jgi:hypothetical protein
MHNALKINIKSCSNKDGPHATAREYWWQVGRGLPKVPAHPSQMRPYGSSEDIEKQLYFILIVSENCF